MGVLSTRHITREQAESIIKEKAAALHRMTDSELESWIDTIWYDDLYNCGIVDKDNPLAEDWEPNL